MPLSLIGLQACNIITSNPATSCPLGLSPDVPQTLKPWGLSSSSGFIHVHQVQGTV